MSQPLIIAIIGFVGTIGAGILGWFGRQYQGNHNGNAKPNKTEVRLLIAEHQENCSVVKDIREMRAVMVTREDLRSLIEQVSYLAKRFDSHLDRLSKE